VARAAVVVVHGIGSQPPLATLGRLAQGLIDHARAHGDAPEARAVLLRVRGEPTSVLRLSGAPSLGGFDTVDVHELAWQGLAQGRARPLAVLRWLVRTGLAPLHVRRHWRVLVDAGDDAPSPWVVVGRQALVATVLLWLVTALLAGVWVAILQLPRAWPLLGAALADAAAALGAQGAAALALGAVPAAVGVASLWGVVADTWEATSLRRRAGGDGWAGATRASRASGPGRPWSSRPCSVRSRRSASCSAPTPGARSAALPARWRTPRRWSPGCSPQPP
jgi:hypothetical protein